jgi:Ni,Fe-hydrogenase III small subunit
VKRASDKTYRVALFGVAPSAGEWAMPCDDGDGPGATVVATAAQADALVVHGPLTPGNWPRFLEWLSQRPAHARLLAVGGEVESRGDLLVDPWRQTSIHRLDAHLTGTAVTPRTLLLFLRASDRKAADV